MKLSDNRFVTDFKDFWDKFGEMSIAILSPIGHPEPRWIRSLANMIPFSWSRNLKIYEMYNTERQVVDWARNNLAEAGKETYMPEWSGKKEKFTHLLWLDDDHVFYPNLACKLAAHLCSSDVDMVGALYVNRYNPDEGGDCFCVAYVKDPEKDYDESKPEDRFSHYPIVLPEPGLIEVDAIGFGAVLMKRDVLDRVPQPWFTLDWRGGEDITFCKRAKEQGIKICLDASTRMGHIGTAPLITYNNHIEYMEEHQDEKIKYGGK
jgi:hypothetical protein